MIERRFAQVDVFTAVPFMGNPVAVVLDGKDLTDEEMQRFARWTNLSETTFVGHATEPGADYRLRIFTPGAELPFAGHPTLGSAYALLDAGLATPNGGRLVQQCGAGFVDIEVPDDWREEGLSFRLPPDRISPAPEPGTLFAALGGKGIVGAPAIVDVGPRWVIAQVDTPTRLATMSADLMALAAYDRAQKTTGLTLFAENNDDAGGIAVRTFAPADGIAEDPVCGSGNGAVAAYRMSNGDLRVGSEYVASQGQAIGRDGRVRVRIMADGIHIGGQCVTCITGVVTL